MNTDKLNVIYDKYKDYFESNFHTALWRILVDNVQDGKLGCFTHGYVSSRGNVLAFAIANEYGYLPLPTTFKEGLTYEEYSHILTHINDIAFGLNEDACALIVISSMRKQNIVED